MALVADDGVQLIDEGDDLPRAVLDVFEHGLEPLLELTAVLRTGHHGAEVERDHRLAAQRFGDVAGDDALGQPLDDGGLADAGLTDEHRVVLGAPRQHLHHATDLGVAADHRVQLAGAGGLGEVGGVLLQRLVAALGVGVGDPGAAAHGGERLAQGVGGGAVFGEQHGDVGITLGQADHDVLGRHVLIAHLGGQPLRRGDRGQRFAAELGVVVAPVALGNRSMISCASRRTTAGSVPTAFSKGAAMPSV